MPWPGYRARMTFSDDQARRPRWRIGVGAAIVVVVVALVGGVLFSAFAPRGETVEIEAPEPSLSGSPPGSPGSAVPEVTGGTLFVHILGEVAKPGLYEFEHGDRGVDAVAAAGGFTKKADQAGLNLARELSDGEQIIVPKVGAKPQPPPGGGTSAGGLINLNTADAAALETLPGIGEALSSRILAWRESHGAFASVDDLGSVAGIGEKTLGALRDLVTV